MALSGKFLQDEMRKPMKKKPKNKTVRWIVAVKTVRAKYPRVFGFSTKKNAMGFMNECATKGGCMVAIAKAGEI